MFFRILQNSIRNNMGIYFGKRFSNGFGIGISSGYYGHKINNNKRTINDSIGCLAFIVVIVSFGITYSFSNSLFASFIVAIIIFFILDSLIKSENIQKETDVEYFKSISQIQKYFNNITEGKVLTAAENNCSKAIVLLKELKEKKLRTKQYNEIEDLLDIFYLVQRILPIGDFLEKAQKAEFKGQKNKALNYYLDILYSFKNGKISVIDLEKAQLKSEPSGEIISLEYIKEKAKLLGWKEKIATPDISLNYSSLQKNTSTNEMYNCPDCNSNLTKNNFTVNKIGLNVCPICSFQFRLEGINENHRIPNLNTNLKGMTIQEMSLKYREIRQLVFNEATMPPFSNNEIHISNQLKLKNKVLGICKQANLSLYNGNDDLTAKRIWHHLWTKNRYAGIKAQIASTEIADIQSIFDEYEIFSNFNWDIQISGHNLISAGKEVHDFLNRNGQFTNKQTIGNLPKLQKIILIARLLKKFREKYPNEQIIKFITAGNNYENVWEIHTNLLEIGYTGDLTALHLMMDLGFQVMKPDIVISTLFLDLGWLHSAIPELPKNILKADLQGKGDYGNRYLYTKPEMYKPVINLARKISSATLREDLMRDIGWVTDNPLREFDLFMVKYGQVPEHEWGITKTLFNP